jgi:MYXO-CTERM domain-containing protein
MTSTSARILIPALGLGLLAALATPAGAKVTLPNGKTIPDPALSCYSGKPGGLSAVFACACTAPGVCNIGKPCPGGSTSCDPGTNGTCESTIWHSVNDNTCIPSNIKGLDPVNDAAVKPETFRPVCGLNFSLLTRGDAMFKNSFGWYNAPAVGAKPDPKDLHVLVDCKTTAGTKTPFNMITHPAYKGGDIGFFLVTPESSTQFGSCAKGDCCATVARALAGEGYIYYSQPTFNPDNKGPGSYIHLLMYASKIDPHAFYFAWEDTYAGSSTDYSDFVTTVSGISCAGAGKTCSTGKSGVCDLGVTKCSPDGKLVCEPSRKAEAEACDGLDNNCDGSVDEGATCTAGKVCYRGACVAKCTDSQEFPCQAGYDCDKGSGLCLDKLCKGKICKTGEICRLGVCANGCSGVVCPAKQLCQSGVCVDPCAGVSCKSAEICVLGVCLPDCSTCGGLTCAKGLSCDSKTGDCYDPSCKPACSGGKYCKLGKCVDPCDGVTCPGGMTCMGGACPPPGIGKSGPGGDGGNDAFPFSDGSAMGPDGGGKDEAGIPPSNAFKEGEGCGCELGSAGRGAAPAAALLMVLLLPLLRRRRR